jgi:hypothetical protein
MRVHPAALLSGSLLVATLMARAEPVSPTTDLKAVLARVAAAYGGESGLARRARQSAQGTVTSPTRGTGTMSRHFERPGNLQVDIAFPSEPAESRTLKDGRGTRNGVPVEGPPLQAMVLQAARVDLPYLLVKEAARVQDVGTLQRDGQARRVVELKLGRGLTMTAELDPSTGRVLRSVGTFLAPGAGPMEFATDYAAFEAMNGTLVARQERNVANGTLTGTTTLEKISFSTP